MANPARRSLGVRGMPPWSSSMEGVSSSAGGVGSMPSSRLARYPRGTPGTRGARQVPEGRLGDLWLGDLSVALPEPVAPSTNMLARSPREWWIRAAGAVGGRGHSGRGDGSRSERQGHRQLQARSCPRVVLGLRQGRQARGDVTPLRFRVVTNVHRVPFGSVVRLTELTSTSIRRRVTRPLDVPRPRRSHFCARWKCPHPPATGVKRHQV